jgi:anti-anti-sigma factor
MELREIRVGDISEYVIAGKLDSTNADEFIQKVSADASFGQKRFVFNLENLEYISSAGLRAFLMIKKMLPEDGFVRIYNLKDQVLEVFQLTSFDTIFKIFRDRDSAYAE